MAPSVSAATRLIDGGRGEQDEADGEQDDGARIRPEIADRREVRRGEQDRRQEQREDEVGLELDLWQVRIQAQQDACGEQEDRLGDRDAPGEITDRDGDREQQQDELDRVERGGRRHVRRSACGPAAG